MYMRNCVFVSDGLDSCPFPQKANMAFFLENFEAVYCTFLR